MKILDLNKKELNYKNFVKTTAQDSDTTKFITESTIIRDADTKEIKIIYDELNLNTSDIVSALHRVKYATGKRTRGLLSTSRIFGFRPRHPIRANYCSATSLAYDQPTENSIICTLAEKLEAFYKEYHPTGYAVHKDLTTEKVKKEWRINHSSIFTSGIINKNNPLKYHFDTGNFNDVYSVMIVFKKDVEGGFLSVPEYDCKIQLKNNSILMFDGQSIMHGVTPIKYQNSQSSYRYSIVYYSLKNMWKCLEVNEEIAWARNRRTLREKTRHNMPEEHRQSLLTRRGKQ